MAEAKQTDLSDLQISGTSEGSSIPFAIICPHCGHHGTFPVNAKPMGAAASFPGGVTYSIAAGPRVCPNLDCRRITFFVTRGNELILTLPPRRMDFDPSSVPTPVRASLEEAITCHANSADRAAALMVRRTLEELPRQRGGRDRPKEAHSCTWNEDRLACRPA